jgi:hypothetical protein
MSPQITRRDFMKLSGGTLGSLALAPLLPPLDQFSDGTLIRVGSNGQENKGIPVYTRPTDDPAISRIVKMVTLDNLLNVYEEVNSGTPDWNPIWYRIWGGYVHRAHMQKVQVIFNNPVESIRKNGQLAEVTIPFTQPLRRIRDDQWETMGEGTRLYYGTVHWVKGTETGPDGGLWYRILDELTELYYDVPARHLRLIPDEEIAPISPEVPFQNKRIEVSLGSQTVKCFEYGKLVLDTRISSGLANGNPGANGIPTNTPSGVFNIAVKMPSKHMGNGDLAADLGAYQLPGVPWVSFFTPHGHAFHGTYWHDNFGVRMSHGCVNMRTEDAKWLFRWSLPAASASDIDPVKLDKRGFGTQIIITPT